MAIKIASAKPKPTKLEKQAALLTGKTPLKKPPAKVDPSSLPVMIREAARKLSTATTAAEVLDAKDTATLAYDVAKSVGRLQRAKGAHDEIVAATHRAQADALEIEAKAKRRLADEYDAAQGRGEVGKKGQRSDLVPVENKVATAEDVGLTRKDVMEAREVRDVLANDPEAVGKALKEILAHGDEPTRAALKRQIAPVIKEIRKEVQDAKKERRAEREVELSAKISALPQAKFGVIVADPEWKFKVFSEETGMDRAAANHYPTSDLTTIMARDVASIAADDAVLFLWIPVPMLVEGICVLDAWGFAVIDRNPETGFLEPDKKHARYVSSFAWLKEKIITGYWTRGKHEVLLIATRGKPVAPAMGDQLPSWMEGEAVVASATDHSAKPEIFLEWIEKMWPTVPKIELNRRGPARPSWSSWGNEAESA